MRFGSKFLVWALFLLLPATPASAQAEIASADLKGVVSDVSHEVIPGATITVTEEAMGISRQVTADAAGQYRVLLLRPGTYAAKVEATGFESQIVTGITLTVGQIARMDFRLTPGVVASTIEVFAVMPTTETEKTQQANTLEQQRIRELPINRRNFLDFALLTPGVTESNTMVDDTDFRVSQAPHSGLSFAGNNGRRNFVSIDGAANVYNSGGVRPTITQAAVQEFQINLSSYTAELGGAGGGVVNIVSKSGNNSLHGEVFGFFRHKSLQARNFFDEQKAPFTRMQEGFAVGGPIRRDKTFFFAGFERLDKQESARVPILSRDPGIFSRLTPSQSLLLDYLDGLPDAPPLLPLKGLSAALRPALLTTNYPATISLFQSNSGIFPFGEALTQMSVKIDHNFSPNHQFFLRDNWTDDLTDNTQFGSLVAFNRGRTIDVFGNTAVMSDTYILNPQTIHQFRFAWSYDNLNVVPTDPLGPELNITGFGLFGRDILQPAKNVERNYQFHDNLTYASGAHTWKFGMEYHAIQDYTRAESFFGGRFSFGEAVPLFSILSASAGSQAFLALNQFLLTSAGVPEGLRTSVAVRLPGAPGPIPVSVALAAPVTALQSFNLGLPTFYQQGFGDPNFAAWAHRFAFFGQDHWKVKPNFTLNLGLRFDAHAAEQPIGSDINNFGPRMGFSWDPFSTGKTVVRGGYGIYFSPVDNQIVTVVNTLNGRTINQTFVPLTGVPGLLNPKTGAPLTSAEIYRTLLSQGVIGQRSIRASDLSQFGITPGPGAPFSVLFQASEDYAIPYSQQASFGLERQIAQDFSLAINYLFNRGVRIPRAVDINIVRAGTDPTTGQPTYTFRNPLLLQLNQYESTANSFYHAMTLSASKRFRDHYSLFASYTLSKAIDEVTDFNSDFEANNQTNLRADRALSSFDQRHRLVVNGILESPFPAGAGNHPLSRALADITVSYIGVVSSARPFNLLVGFDNVGDRHPNTHRPFGAGRNIGRGPDFFTLDLRLSKRFRLPNRKPWSLEFTAEAFNLLNRTNFKNINNTVGDVRLQGKDLIDPSTGHSINKGQLEGRTDQLPTQPLGFTSTFDPRQFQLGLQILF